MGLSDASTRSAKPSNRQYKLADEKGLFVLVNTNGSKLISLRLACDRRDDARKLLAQGEDPGELCKAQKLARSEAPKNTFEAVQSRSISVSSPRPTAI